MVPGGSTNVFVRAIGLPAHPFDATGAILEALRAGRSRRIGLGLADDRYFTFNAGLGFDAEVVHRIEKRRRAGEQTSHARFVRAALTHYVTADRRHPAITLERPGEDPVDHLHFALVTNAAPWSYLGERPVQPSPEASFDTGLDVFAPRSLGFCSLCATFAGRCSVRRRCGASGCSALHDVAEFTLRASRPMALQLDGDWLGERESVRFRSVPNVLRVIV